MDVKYYLLLELFMEHLLNSDEDVHLNKIVNACEEGYIQISLLLAISYYFPSTNLVCRMYWVCNII